MTTTKLEWLRNFGEFRGLDYKTPDILSAPGYYANLQNYELAENGSLRGRVGHQPIAQPGQFMALHTYSYFDNVTGATKQELLALNDHLWRLKWTTLSIECVSGSPNWTWWIALDASSQTYRFYISQGGSLVTWGSGLTYFDCGYGAYNPAVPAAYKTILDLRDAIDALANFTCAMPTLTARCNGDQSTTKSITVFSGHTFAACDVVSGWSLDGVAPRLCAERIESTTATGLVLCGSSGAGPEKANGFTVANNQVLGIGAVPACAIPINDVAAENSTATKTVPFAYWEQVPTSLKSFRFCSPFYEPYANYITGIRGQAPCCLNANQSVYFFGSAISGVNLSYPMKYDGQRVERMGIPRSYYTSAAVAGGAGLLTGTYRYTSRLAIEDKNGIINVGSDSDAYQLASLTLSSQNGTLGLGTSSMAVQRLSTTVNNADVMQVSSIAPYTGTSIPVDAHTCVVGDYILVGNRVSGTRDLLLLPVLAVSTSITGLCHIEVDTSVTVNDGDRIYKNPPLGFSHAGAVVSGGTSGTTISVDSMLTRSTGHNLYVGDKIQLIDRSSGKLVSRVLTAVTATTLTWSATEGAVTVNDNDIISLAYWEIGRTKTGGTDFYVLDRVPVPHYFEAASEFYSYTDNKSDTRLVEKMTLPSAILDLPPRASIACLHQGVIACAGIDENPNLVGYSLPNDDYWGVEAFPLASNYFDVPSNTAGPITAIASDTADRLAIFKPDSYYDAPGDFTANNFTVYPVTEGDYGVSSHDSLRRVGGVLIGVGPLGFVGVKAGAISRSLGLNINTVFEGNKNLCLHRARAINNSHFQYRCFIPGLSSQSLSSANSRMFVLDYEAEDMNEWVWFNWHYPAAAPDRGSAVCSTLLTRGSVPVADYENAFFFMGGTYGQAFMELATETPAKNYADAYSAIPYIFKSRWEHLDEPLLNKVFQHLVLYALSGDYGEGFTPFSFLVETFRNFSSAAHHTAKTVTFSASTTLRQDVKLLDGQALALQFQLTTNTIGECPILSGYALGARVPYELEDVRK